MTLFETPFTHTVEVKVTGCRECGNSSFESTNKTGHSAWRLGSGREHIELI
jgi:hypothetical protein